MNGKIRVVAVLAIVGVLAGLALPALAQRDRPAPVRDRDRSPGERSPGDRPSESQPRAFVIQFKYISVDSFMETLGQLSGLRTLILRDVKISDAGLAKLTSLSNLGRLDLRGVPITDVSVPHLAQFTQLKELDIVGTGITQTGLAELKKAFPEAKIAY